MSGDHVDRALGLLASGWVTAERLASAVRSLLESGGLVAADPSPDEVLTILERRVRRAGARADPARVRLVGERLAATGALLRVVGGDGYPEHLATAWPELGAPLWLAVRAQGGRLPDGPAVGIVGTRHPTLDGLHTAQQLGRLLGRHGVTVVSGMARGIDQAAHRGCMDAGGRTIAVLGAGFDVDYPRGDGALREQIAASGALVTELAPDAPPRARHFLARNRIISGLSDVVVVVEGQARSGALVTARLAAGQGRDVWAVPGSLHAPTSQGPLALIRDGAQVVTSLGDVLDAVLDTAAGPVDEPPGPARPPIDPAERPGDLSAPARAVLALLGASPATPGALAAASGHPLPAVLAATTELAARGLATATPRGLVRVVRA